MIRGASVVDGTGASAYRANVLVKGDTIAVIDTQMRTDVSAARVIDANGRVLAPGFIDLHTHGDPLGKSFENFLAMGVTTVVMGQDGSSVDLEGRRPRRHLRSGRAQPRPRVYRSTSRPCPGMARSDISRKFRTRCAS